MTRATDDPRLAPWIDAYCRASGVPPGVLILALWRALAAATTPGQPRMIAESVGSVLFGEELGDSIAGPILPGTILDSLTDSGGGVVER